MRSHAPSVLVAPAFTGLAVALTAALLLACGGGGGGSHGPDCGALTACGGVCVDTTSDPAHCGGCAGHACPIGASCTASECRCPDGQTPCNGACVDLQSSADHCGVCGHACGLGTCQAGGCVCEGSPVRSCPSSSPECVDPDTDGANCGECGHVCASVKAGSQCGGGTCRCLSPRPDDCGACTNRQTDSANCGDCGHSCQSEKPGSQCGSGTCQCLSPRPDACNGGCVSFATDAANCKTCGHACPTGATCASAECQCPSATPKLCPSSNTCVNTVTDAANCGACGFACPSTATCAASSCACPDAKIICGSSPGQCCAGTTCCTGGTCQTAHANGLGQSYYDCSATMGQWTATQAIAAAQAFAPSAPVIETGTLLGGCLNCKCTTKGSQAAVWCYAGSPSAGLVGLYDAATCQTTPGCPAQGMSSVHAWQ